MVIAVAIDIKRFLLKRQLTMSAKIIENSPGYSAKVAAIFLFNLLTGVGILALPAAVAKAGLLSGILILVAVAFMAFVSLTFVIEVLSTANAWTMLHPKTNTKGSSQSYPCKSVGEKLVAKSKLTNSGSFNPFDIKERVEMGHMAELFLGSAGSTFFYAVLCLYLYGDLAIYAVSVATTLTRCTGADPDISYYSFLLGFLMIIGPFCFFNFQKTAHLQMFTMVMRNSAIVLMVILSVVDVINGNRVPFDNIILWDIPQTKELLGLAVFSFMCHHSIAPIILLLKDKKKSFTVILFDYMIELLYCTVLILSAAMNRPASEINSLYTLNFGDYPIKVLAKFLSFYPVFTLSSNFPLICITLRNNLLTLFQVKQFGYNQQVFTLVALIPPAVVAVFVHDIKKLVVLTGSFAGLAIMFITPALLVLYSRHQLQNIIGSHWRDMHPHLSPFQHRAWVYLVLTFAAFVLLCKIF